MSEVIPLCARCNHKATSHVVDDEELRECMEWGCDCEQFEIDLIPCGPKPEEMDGPSILEERIKK